MNIPPRIQKDILGALSSLPQGAMITEIEQHVAVERHTLSKYLSLLRHQGILHYRSVGKAKLWSINKAPLPTIFNAPSGQQNYIETVVLSVIHALPLGFMLMDQLFQLQFLNAQAKQLYGDGVGKKFYDHILGKPNPLSTPKLTELIEHKIDDASFVVKDSKQRYMQITAGRISNPDQSESLLLTLMDVSKEKEAQELVAAQRRMLQAERDALNAAAIVAETDIQGKITYVNDKFMQISGYSKRELIGKTHRVINSSFHPPQFFKNMWMTISSGRVWTGLIKNKRKDGSYYWVDSAIAPILGKNGKPEKYIAIRFDVTKLMNIIRKK